MTQVLVVAADGGIFSSITAWNDNQFAIKYNGVIYLTQALWIFDPTNAAPNSEQASGCSTMSQLFQESDSILQAVLVQYPPNPQTSDDDSFPAPATATSPTSIPKPGT
jgi:hypothetical protein